MGPLHSGPPTSAQAEAYRANARRRRLSLAGVPQLQRTFTPHSPRIDDRDDPLDEVIAIESIDTGAYFPDRTKPITFETAIRVLEGGGEHRGTIFEFGGEAAGAFLWVHDRGIGFHAGQGNDAKGASAIWGDFNSPELPVGAVIRIVAAAIPGRGLVRLWGNGRELARGAAELGTFDSEWSDGTPGCYGFAAAGEIVDNVPTEFAGAPSGFEIISKLKIYQGQVPRHFV